jgi:hypothetical protein
MSAVDNLLAHLSAIESALQKLSSGSVHTDIERLALRGIAVQALSAFEQFVIDRAEEWSHMINMKRLPPQALPGGVLAADEWRSRVVDRLPRRYRNTDNTGRAQLFSEIATSLKSFNEQTVITHNLFFDWPGSNIQTQDIEDLLRLLGIKDVWADMTRLWKRLDPGLQAHVTAKNLFIEVRDTRHSAAHDASYDLAYISAGALIRSLHLMALLFDCIGSVAANQISVNCSPINSVSQSICVRALRKDGLVWREFRSLSQTGRAFRRHQDRSTGIAESLQRLNPPYDILVAFDGNRVLDWRTCM